MYVLKTFNLMMQFYFISSADHREPTSLYIGLWLKLKQPFFCVTSPMPPSHICCVRLFGLLRLKRNGKLLAMAFTVIWLLLLKFLASRFKNYEEIRTGVGSDSC